MAIPNALLRRLYVGASLHNVEDGFEFKLRNMVAPATVVAMGPVEVDGVPYGPNQVTLSAGRPRPASAITHKQPFLLQMGREVLVKVRGARLERGAHQVALHALTREIGPLVIDIDDSV
ncbi:MAG: hypothetical protein K1X65_11575 [Caldilineales bacterium]|nr:hypothetical protein [Caldilineales bacterium]MCW5858804.1 hypothetical protein [Caldilineales bacterium]